MTVSSLLVTHDEIKLCCTRTQYAWRMNPQYLCCRAYLASLAAWTSVDTPATALVMLQGRRGQDGEWHTWLPDNRYQTTDLMVSRPTRVTLPMAVRRFRIAVITDLRFVHSGHISSMSSGHMVDWHRRDALTKVDWVTSSCLQGQQRRFETPAASCDQQAARSTDGNIKSIVHFNWLSLMTQCAMTVSLVPPALWVAVVGRTEIQ